MPRTLFRAEAKNRGECSINVRERLPNWTAPVLVETERFSNPKRQRGIVPNSFPRLRFGLLFRKKWRCPTKHPPNCGFTSVWHLSTLAEDLSGESEMWASRSAVKSTQRTIVSNQAHST